MRILISGVAGEIGFGLGRILRDWNFFDELHGIDISQDHQASLIFDSIDVAPRADADDYLEWLICYLKLHKIDVFVPTSEAEILQVSRNITIFDSICRVLINDSHLIEKSLDKNKTLKFLNNCGIEVPEHGLVESSCRPTRYPVIVKPRRRQGSKGLRKLSNNSEFSKIGEGYVWQEYLTPDEEEYTCAVYVPKALEPRVLLLKRVLVGGYTGRATVVENLEIKKYVKKIIAAWNVSGLYNIQLRLTAEGPKLFEINPRISSTVVFRDKLGFEDFKWWVLEALEMDLPHYEEVCAGTKIYRGNTEYIKRSRSIRRVIDMNFELIIPTSAQIETLYIQLKKRSHSISHKSFPSFDEHTKFVQNHPYRKWIIVKNADTAIGNVYIQFDNSIGLNLDSSVTFEQTLKILKQVYISNSPLHAVPSVRFGEFFLKVSSDNHMLQERLSSIGFREVERTFVIKKLRLKEWED
jgi:carbamoyl-phosphate synthase large subunit